MRSITYEYNSRSQQQRTSNSEDQAETSRKIEDEREHVRNCFGRLLNVLPFWHRPAIFRLSARGHYIPERNPIEYPPRSAYDERRCTRCDSSPRLPFYKEHEHNDRYKDRGIDTCKYCESQHRAEDDPLSYRNFNSLSTIDLQLCIKC